MDYKKEIADTAYHAAVVGGVSLGIGQAMKMAFGVQPPTIRPTARDIGLTFAYSVAGEIARQRMVDMKWIPASIVPAK